MAWNLGYRRITYFDTNLSCCYIFACFRKHVPIEMSVVPLIRTADENVWDPKWYF